MVRGGDKALSKGSKITINTMWEAITIGSRKVGNNVHQRGSGDNTKI